MVKAPSHACLTAAPIVTSMALLDAFLLGHHSSSWRVVACVAVAAGDACFLVMLRYVAVWAESEMHTARRGYATILWFFYVFVLEIKVYFIHQSYKSEDGGAPRRALTLLLAVCVPVVFITLAAVDHLEFLQPRKKREMRSRLFWVVLDLLDLLDVQASLWERQRGGLPVWVEATMFFYCYLLLLLLPCVCLSEISLQGANAAPHRMLLYPIFSLATVNITTLLIRGGNLLIYGDRRASGTMMGKNVTAIVLKSCSLLELRRPPPASPPAARGGGTLRNSPGDAEVSGRQVLPRVIIQDFTSIPEEQEDTEDRDEQMLDRHLLQIDTQYKMDQ